MLQLSLSVLLLMAGWNFPLSQKPVLGGEGNVQLVLAVP